MPVSMWPQLLWVMLASMGFALTLSRNKHWTDYAGTMLAASITWGLLYAGGFFDVFWR